MKHPGSPRVVARVFGALAVAVALAAMPVAGAAHASNQVIFATVAPIVGIGVDSAGNVTQGGSTIDVSITREQRGDTLVITIMPIG